MKTRHILLGLGLSATVIGLGLVERQRSVRAKRWKQGVMFSETLAVELAGTDIHVQALCPGFTLSEFHDDPQYIRYRLKERIPHWLWMTSEQVVDESLRALCEGQTVCIPGWQNQLIVAAAHSGASVFLLNLLRSFFPRSASDTAGTPNHSKEL